jgi:hypothetical protein
MEQVILTNQPQLPPDNQQSSSVKPPKELVHLFADPPVGRNERREDYENLFAAIAAAEKPADAIAWMFTRDIADLSWEIRREKNLKNYIIRAAEIYVVERLLTPPPPPSKLCADGSFNFFPIDPGPDPQAREEARQWASGDAEAHLKIAKKLADGGDDASYILNRALQRSHPSIDAIDKRIATYELRRMAALRALEQYDEKLARRLEAASSEVIEGEFTEVSE